MITRSASTPSISALTSSAKVADFLATDEVSTTVIELTSPQSRKSERVRRWF